MREQLLQQTLGQLASQIPGATRLFREHQLDFCCGGQHTLEQACQQPGLNREQLLEALQALSQQPGSDQDWQATATPALIDHLLTRYHARHRQQFEELIRLASRVEQVHAASGDCPHGLTDFLHEMREALESHMMKEEQILFPMLLQGAGMMAGGPISVMRFEPGAARRVVPLGHAGVGIAGDVFDYRIIDAAISPARNRCLRYALLKFVHT